MNNRQIVKSLLIILSILLTVSLIVGCGGGERLLKKSTPEEINLLKTSHIKKIKLNQEGKEDIDLLIGSIVGNILVEMGFKIVSPNSTDFDVELRIGNINFDAVGSFALEGSPYIVLGYSSKINLYHQGGIVFEEEIVSPIEKAFKMVEKGGRFVRSSPSDPKEEDKMMKEARDKLQKLFQIKIPGYLEKYLGRGIELLLSGLKSEDAFLRNISAKSLGKLGDSRAIDPLIAVLKDEDKDVRESTAIALEKITGQKLGEDSIKWQEWWGKNKAK